MSDNRVNWCPMGTCRRCDELRTAEQIKRCPNQPKGDFTALLGVALTLLALIGVALVVMS